MYFWKRFETFGLQELWMKINTGRKIQHLAVHNLVKNYGYSFCCILPALHYLTGSKNTSKIGTKLKAIESNPHEYLINFGSEINEGNFNETIKSAERWLIQVLRKGSECSTFNDLRNFDYTSGRTVIIADLPPTTNLIKYHILRAYYLTHQKITIFNANNLDKLDPHMFGYIADGKSDKLIPQKVDILYPPIYELPPPCKCTKCTRNCSCKNFNVLCCTFCKCVKNNTCENYIFL